jgi:hypothetical protein
LPRRPRQRSRTPCSGLLGHPPHLGPTRRQTGCGRR